MNELWGGMKKPNPADEERKYKVEDAIRTLTKAEEHRQDKELMKEVKKTAKEKAKKMMKACG